MEEVGGVKQKSKKKEIQYGKRYGFEFKLRCVKLRLEEGQKYCLSCRNRKSNVVVKAGEVVVAVVVIVLISWCKIRKEE